MNTTIRHRARRQGTIVLVAAALVGLLATSPGRQPTEGVSGPVSATPTVGAPIAPAASGSNNRDRSSVRIELVAGDEVATAILDDTPEARDFAAMLPITVDMEDRFGQAKTGLLPRALRLDDPARSRSYAAGDLSYWSPSGRVSVVYDALGRPVPPPGLVRLGTVDTGLQTIARTGNDFTMTIRRAQ
jgi:hypothetical protein